MAKVAITKSLLDSLAQHINAKAGTTGAKTIAQMQAAVDGIATADANHLRFTHNNPSAVSGGGNYVTIVAGDGTLKQVRSLDSLFVVYSATGTASCTKSGCLWHSAENVIITADEGSLGTTKRFNSSGGYSNAPQICRADDSANISTGSGRIYITEDGDLRIYGNTNGYPILAGEIVVDVIW